MSKKDFELIARILRGLPVDCYGTEQVAERFAEELQRTNPRFDAARFLTACGVRP